VTNFTRGGTRGTEIEIRSGDDYRVDVTNGPFSSAHGTSGGVSWQQNENGETVLTAYDSEHEGDERTDEAIETTLVHETLPDDRYVIQRLTALGNGIKDYVDPATWQIVRHVATSPIGTRIVTFDDFRTTAGFVRPWHWTVSDGHPENDAEYRIASIENTAVATAALAVPKPRRTLVEFPAGANSVTLPAQLDHDRRRFVVRVTIGKRGLDFMLDTGASRIVIDRDVARELGLTEYAVYSNAINAGRYTGTRSIVPSMAIGPLELHDVVIDTIPHVGGDTGPYRIVGLLGFDFLEDVCMKLDYQLGVATAYAPAAFVAPTNTGTIGLDVRLGSHQPETNVSINGAPGKRFVLDTGGAGVVLIDDYFRRLHPAAVVDAGNGDARSETMLGLGGTFETKLYKIASMTVGSETFNNFYANVVTTSTAYTGNQDGLIGPDFFELFTVYTDFPRRKMYLVPNDFRQKAIIPTDIENTAPPPPIVVPTDEELGSFAPRLPH
jgi:predicted aspartyl protease